jgi:hypothetical protein
MAIDGFRVNLGAPVKGGDIKDMVSKESLAELLAKARAEPGFEKAKGDYEFRLRKLGGEAVLELRRPTTGFFAKIWGGGRRSAERTAAYEAIGRQLPSLGARSGDMRKADAREAATKIIGLQDFQSKVADGSLFSEIRPSGETIARSLEALRENGMKDKFVEFDGIKVRNQTMTFLNRADVSVDASGTLRIKSPGKGPGDENLKKILDHVGAGAGTSRNDPMFRTVAENLLTCVRSGADQLIGRIVQDRIKDDFGITALGTPSNFEMAFKVDGMKVDVSVSQTVKLKQIDNLEADPTGYSARLDFWWGMADEEGIAGSNFDERKAFDTAFACAPEGVALDVKST